MDRRTAPTGRLLTIALVLVVISAAVGILVWAQVQIPATAGPHSAGGIRDVIDLTSRLGATFHPGAIQAFGANSSAVFLTGNSVWNATSDASQPTLDELSGTGPAVNVTRSLNSAFDNGSVFGAVWNGSSWLIAGNGAWGSLHVGVLLSLAGGHWDNLTPLVGTLFDHGGIWAIAWNGTGWLLAGNSSTRAVLLSFDGLHVRDLTSLIPSNRAGDWIQLLVWNGNAWMVGGGGVFGLLSSVGFTDLLPASPFGSGGVFAADWDGSVWLVGGGAPAALAIVRGTQVVAGPSLPAGFDRWVNAIIWTQSGWVVAGKGSAGLPGNVGSTPELAFWASNGTGTVDDLSSMLPSSFSGGQVQFAWWAPILGPRAMLLAGQGSLNAVSGYSVGALAQLDVA